MVPDCCLSSALAFPSDLGARGSGIYWLAIWIALFSSLHHRDFLSNHNQEFMKAMDISQSLKKEKKKKNHIYNVFPITSQGS